jgi:hypothetical protein
MTLPELEELCRRYPHHEIYILVGSQKKDDRMAVKAQVDAWVGFGQVRDAVVTTTDDLAPAPDDSAKCLQCGYPMVQYQCEPYLCRSPYKAPPTGPDRYIPLCPHCLARSSRAGIGWRWGRRLSRFMPGGRFSWWKFES